MSKKERLLSRLDAIGQALAQSGKGLALLGLGSAGSETARMDDYSDLDFFAVVQAGYKGEFLNDLQWLGAIQPIAYAFQNTVDGYKLLFDDGIFCEFAIFEAHELANIPFASARTVWRDPSFDDSDALARQATSTPPATTEWLLGEALTCLYVGLGRYRRGEKLTAMRFIQDYALDKVVKLVEQLETAQPTFVDGFAVERRLEQRFPQFASQLPAMAQGYERSVESAQAILTFLNTHFAVNTAPHDEIVRLCADTA